MEDVASSPQFCQLFYGSSQLPLKGGWLVPILQLWMLRFRDHRVDLESQSWKRLAGFKSSCFPILFFPHLFWSARQARLRPLWGTSMERGGFYFGGECMIFWVITGFNLWYLSGGFYPGSAHGVIRAKCFTWIGELFHHSPPTPSLQAILWSSPAERVRDLPKVMGHRINLLICISSAP